MIQAFPPNGSDQPLDISPLPRRSRSGQHLLNVHVPDLAAELVAEDFVAVSQQIPWDLLKRKRLPQLLRGPLRGRVSGYVKVHHPTPLMRQHQKYVQHLEADRGHAEEIDRDQRLGVVIEEGAPSLRRRSALPDHVFGHTGLADGDAQFEQLTMDVGRAPERVVAAHLPDQIADFAGDPRSTWFAAAHFPGPEQAKALAMPRDDGLRPDDGQRRAPVLPNTRQDDP